MCQMISIASIGFVGFLVLDVQSCIESYKIPKLKTEQKQ